MIHITSKQAGFRRCGIAHSAEQTEYPNDAFTPDQLQQLQAEPMLVVEVTEEAGGSGQSTRPNAQASIALVQAVTTIEELDKLAAGEDRKGVNDAIAKRRAELTA